MTWVCLLSLSLSLAFLFRSNKNSSMNRGHNIVILYVQHRCMTSTKSNRTIFILLATYKTQYLTFFIVINRNFIAVNATGCWPKLNIWKHRLWHKRAVLYAFIILTKLFPKTHIQRRKPQCYRMMMKALGNASPSKNTTTKLYSRVTTRPIVASI